MDSKQNKTVRVDLGFSPKILDRYVAKEFLLSYVVAVASVLSLRIVMDLLILGDEFVEANAAGEAPGALTVIGYIFDYYWPKIFEYFRDFSGTMIFLAACFSLVRMTRQNELTAILASGVSLKRIIAPIVFIALFLNVLMVIDQEVILPKLADKLVRRPDERDALRKKPVWLLPDVHGSLLSATKFDPEKNEMENFFVVLCHEEIAMGHIASKKATWNASDNRWDLQDGLFVSYDGITEHPALKPEWASSNYGVIPVPYYESNHSANYLWKQRNSNFKTLLSSDQLTSIIQKEIKAGEQREAISEKHFRFTDPMINMAMLLLGLPMLISRERRNTKTSLILATIGPLTCFMFTFICKLIGAELANPLLAAWMPLIIFLPLSVLALDSLKT